MAIVAIVTTIDVILVLPDRGDAIVTGAAGAKNLRVINRKCWRPNVWCVAVFADIRRRNMGVALAGRLYAVVATDTIPGDVDMVKIGRYPAVGCMTVVAVVTARNVRRVLACRSDAIVAGTTGAEYLCVVNSDSRHIGDGAVAILADIGGLDMRRSFTSGRQAVVAGNAITDDSDVIEKGGQPAGNVMAVVALIVGRNMVRRLSGSLSAIVAADTTAGDR